MVIGGKKREVPLNDFDATSHTRSNGAGGVIHSHKTPVEGQRPGSLINDPTGNLERHNAQTAKPVASQSQSRTVMTLHALQSLNKASEEYQQALAAYAVISFAQCKNYRFIACVWNAEKVAMPKSGLFNHGETWTASHIRVLRYIAGDQDAALTPKKNLTRCINTCNPASTIFVQLLDCLLYTSPSPRDS